MHRLTDFANWLDVNGLGRHREVLQDAGIDFDVLSELSEEDLRELNLPLGDRKRLLKAVREQPDGSPQPPSGPGASPDASPGASPTPTPASDSASATPISAISGGDRRQVTVMFADISGFTRLSSSRDAEEVHALLDRFFGVVDGAIAAHGGTVDKHIGDEVMALFGAPVAHTDDPERAVRAAFAAHEALAKLAEPIPAHIGIASGQVVASRTGSGDFAEYTVTGGSVNLASRLTGLARPGETVISEEVRGAVADVAECEALGEVEVKGLSEAVTVWRLARLSERSDGGNERVFVGRGREKRQLDAVIADCLEDRSGQIVLVRGEPGIGKTSLVDRFEERAGAAGFERHKGLVLDFGTGRGRDAIPALVASMLGIDPRSREDLTTETIATKIAKHPALATDTIHLNDLLGLAQPPELAATHAAMDNAARVSGRARAVSNLAAELAGERPLLLRIEDVHWAAPEPLAQISEIARAIAELPAIVVMTTRIDNDPIDAAWRASARDCPLTTIDLGPLREADARELAEDHFGVSAAMAQTFIERAAGNPLFLDQLLRGGEESLVGGVPGSVQSVVQARMDALDEVDKAALQAASVLGQRFSPATVAAMINEPGYTCTRLAERQLARPEGEDFLFAHALVREGVYASLLRDRRADLHARAAEWYRATDPVLLAEHLSAAGDPGAAEAYLAAGRDRAAAYRPNEALDLAERGLAFEADATIRFEIQMLKGEMLRQLGRAPDSIATYEDSIAQAPGASQAALAHIGVAQGMRIIDQFEGAFDHLDAADDLAREIGDQATRAGIAFMRGNLLFPLGRIEDCLQAHTQALEFARAAGHIEHEVEALGGLGDANYVNARLHTSHRYFTECVALARQHGFARIEIANLPMVAWMSMLLGNYDTALSEANEARAVASRVGSERADIIALNGISSIAIDRGDAEAAIESSRMIVELALRIGAPRFEAYGKNMLAQALALSGDMAAAHETHAEALGLVKNQGVSGFVGPWVLASGAVLADTADEARALLERGEVILKSGAVAHNHFYFRRFAIDVLIELEDWDQVRYHAKELAEFVGEEATELTEFVVNRALALADWAEGNRSEATRAALAAAFEWADKQKLAPMAPVFGEALASFS